MRNTLAWKYYCRDSKASKIDGLAPVELSLSVNGKRVFINLPFKCKPSDFAKKRGRPKEIDEYLNAQTSTINKVLAEMAENGIPVTAERLRDYFRTGGVKSYTIQDMADEFLSIQKERIGNGICLSVYRRYKMVIDLFRTHMDFNEEVTAISNSIVRKFYAYLDNKYENSTSVGMKTKFKAFIRFGMDNDRIKINPMQGLKIEKKRKEIIYLKEDEIKRIIETKIDNESLARVRDAFVLQLSTGLAYADLCALKKEDIQIREDGTHFITKPRIKTGATYVTLVLPEGIEVLKRYNYNLHVISIQKFNYFLKSIQVCCNIKTNLTSHVARRTFGQRLLSKGVRLETVSKALGHRNTNITQQYYCQIRQADVIKEIKEVCG